MTPRARSDDYAQKLYGRASDEAVADAVEAVAQSRGLAPAQVSLAWTLARPGVVAAIFGPTRIEHVDAALSALEIRLEPAALHSIAAAYEPRPAAGHGI